MTELAGVAYPRLLPSSLLPPEDPSGPAARRTLRDWLVDIVAVVLSAGFGILLVSDSIDSAVGHVPDGELALDWLLGAVAITAVWWRRRYPVGVAILATVLSAVSAFAAAASAIALFTTAVHCRTGVAVGVGLLGIAAGAIFPVYRPQTEAEWSSVLLGVLVAGVLIAWGMFVRARRQLIWTLRARAERAEAEQQLQAERTRAAERTRIAREMHDVLAHRISLLALHAGGLQVRPDLPAEQVRQTAELLRETAHRALEELRGVIGVLRDADDEAPAQPQPTLRDVPQLIDDNRRVGAKIDFRLHLDDDAQPPDSLGRDAYRIVQEALTNVAKHAPGTATTVDLKGGPGAELRVTVRNRLPVGSGSDSPIPGSQRGLLGLRERVTLTGGTLWHGPNDAGEFVVDARLAWPGPSHG